MNEAPHGVSCASLVDAMGRLFTHRADFTGFVTPTPGRVLFGPAVTMEFVPYRQDLHEQRRPTFASVFYEAVGEAAAGKVLVISSGGYPSVSHGGGTKLSRAENHGLAGVLADGTLRDFRELAAYRFATYCRGEAVRVGGGTVMPFAANTTVEVAGVTIQPGDHLYVDAAGGVVIPAAALDDVVACARTVEDEDARARGEIRAERLGSTSNGPEER